MVAAPAPAATPRTTPPASSATAEERSAGSAALPFGIYAEVALVTGAMLCFGLLTGDWFHFVALAPSPLLLPVLWAALRGGLVPALFATALVSCLHTLGMMAIAGDRLSVLAEERVTWPLFGFAAVAFVVGQTRDALAAQIRSLRGMRERLRAETRRQRHDLEVLQHANRELKRRIFDRSFDFDSLVATVARSTVDESAHMFESPLGMLVDFCGATKCSALLVLPDGELDLAAHRGWTDEEIGSRLQAANQNGRIRRSIADAVPVVDVGDEQSSDSGPLLVAPIADGTGVIKAVICIDEMPPQRFEESTVKTFLGIVSWLATNLRRMQLREASGEGSQQMLQALDKKKHVGAVGELAERIYLDDSRRKRYGVETQLIAIRLLDVRVNMAEYVESIEEHLVSVLSSAVRPTDDVFQFGFAGCYLLMMTGCHPGNGDKIVERLDARFRQKRDLDLGPVDLKYFSTTTEAPTLAELLPVLTDHFCGNSPLPLAQQCPVPEPRPQRGGNAAQFARRLRLETDLARRFGAELNMVDFRRSPGAGDDGATAGSGIGPMIARHLWNAVGTLLRVTDGIYVVNPNRCVVLLPFTSCLDASRIWSRLDEMLKRTLPAEHYEGVQADFLALDPTSLRHTVNYLVGAEENAPDADSGPGLLTENELQQLAFTDAEFADMRPAHSDLEKDFRVVASTDTNLPPLPSPEAMTKRWEEVFERPERAPTVPAGESTFAAAKPTAFDPAFADSPPSPQPGSAPVPLHDAPAPMPALEPGALDMPAAPAPQQPPVPTGSCTLEALMATVEAAEVEAAEVEAVAANEEPMALPSGADLEQRWEELFEREGSPACAPMRAPVAEAAPPAPVTMLPLAGDPFPERSTIDLLMAQIEGLRALALRLGRGRGKEPGDG